MKKSIRWALALTMTAAAIAPAIPAQAGRGGKNNAASTEGSAISLVQAGTQLRLGGTVSYTSSAVGLLGGEYPLVYTVCKNAAGTVVYGQLDYPDTVFVLGGGSSPWLLVGGDATCEGQLRAYGGKSQGQDTIRTLATTPPFAVAG